MATVGSEPNGRATIREVYDLLEGLEDRLDRKFGHLEDKIAVTMLAHEQSHKSMREEAISRFRWMVGCALGFSTILASVIGFVYR